MSYELNGWEKLIEEIMEKLLQSFFENRERYQIRKIIGKWAEIFDELDKAAYSTMIPFARDVENIYFIYRHGAFTLDSCLIIYELSLVNPLRHSLLVKGIERISINNIKIGIKSS